MHVQVLSWLKLQDWWCFGVFFHSMLTVTVTFRDYKHVVRNKSQFCSYQRATKKIRTTLKSSCKVLKALGAHLGYI
jgi:hypothetical protein